MCRVGFFITGRERQLTWKKDPLKCPAIKKVFDSSFKLTISTLPSLLQFPSRTTKHPSCRPTDIRRTSFAVDVQRTCDRQTSDVDLLGVHRSPSDIHPRPTDVHPTSTRCPCIRWPSGVFRMSNARDRRPPPGDPTTPQSKKCGSFK